MDLCVDDFLPHFSCNVIMFNQEWKTISYAMTVSCLIETESWNGIKIKKNEEETIKQCEYIFQRIFFHA